MACVSVRFHNGRQEGRGSGGWGMYYFHGGGGVGKPGKVTGDSVGWKKVREEGRRVWRQARHGRK